jgi:hypothetical protein
MQHVIIFVAIIIIIMRINYNLIVWLGISIITINLKGFAQNLIQNPDLEITTPQCNQSNNELYTDQTPVENWYGNSSVNGFNSGITPDYFNANCAGAGNGTFNCGSGNGSLGFFTYDGDASLLREYIQSPLLQPLKAGEEYCFSMTVKNGNEILELLPLLGHKK